MRHIKLWPSAVVLTISLAAGCQESSKAAGQIPSELLQRWAPIAVRGVIHENVLDPNIKLLNSNAPLSSSGHWSVEKNVPLECADGAETCVAAVYTVPDQGVSCRWVVKVSDNGNKTVIVEENESAARYFVRKIEPSAATPLISTRHDVLDPPIAQAAHIGGDVVLRLVISSTGTLESLSVISGPPMLQGAALDAIKQWSFLPLKTGKVPVRWQTQVVVHFDKGGPGRRKPTTTP